MSQASTYRVQDGCADCHHVFVRKEYDSDDELYCNFGAPERPPCMSVSMCNGSHLKQPMLAFNAISGSQ